MESWRCPPAHAGWRLAACFLLTVASCRAWSQCGVAVDTVDATPEASLFAMRTWLTQQGSELRSSVVPSQEDLARHAANAKSPQLRAQSYCLDPSNGTFSTHRAGLWLDAKREGPVKAGEAVLSIPLSLTMTIESLLSSSTSANLIGMLS